MNFDAAGAFGGIINENKKPGDTFNLFFIWWLQLAFVALTARYIGLNLKLKSEKQIFGHSASTFLICFLIF